MDGLLVLGAVQVEPVRDVRKLDQDLSPTAGLLADLAQGGLLVGLPGFYVALRERPDARHTSPNQEGFEGRTIPPQDEPAGGDFVLDPHV